MHILYPVLHEYLSPAVTPFYILWPSLQFKEQRVNLCVAFCCRDTTQLPVDMLCFGRHLVAKEKDIPGCFLHSLHSILVILGTWVLLLFFEMWWIILASQTHAEKPNSQSWENDPPRAPKAEWLSGDMRNEQCILRMIQINKKSTRNW